MRSSDHAAALPRPTEIDWLAETDSTNEEALRRAAAGAAGPLWIAARTQTAGRGRRGRPWLSQDGDLSASLLVTPEALRPHATPAEVATLSFAAALAVADMVDAFAPSAPVALKWPNDVLLDGRKLAGLLLERRGSTLVVGVGVNLVSAPDAAALPPDAWLAAALAEHAPAAPTPAAALTALAAAMDHHLVRWVAEGFAALRHAWLARAARLGERIEARLPRETVSGRFADVDASGALVLETSQGVRLISAAEVFFPQPTPAPG